MPSSSGNACLRPWHDFPQLQQQYFDSAYSLLCPDESSPRKLFSSRVALEDLGQTLCRRPLASEKDLESYERFAVEEKVKDVSAVSYYPSVYEPNSIAICGLHVL
jgi:hypothetical protein